jgi:hypothetical protein
VLRLWPLAGQVSSYGPRISYTEQGKPQTAFTLVLQKGQFKTFVPCLIVGAKAEAMWETLEAGDLVLLDDSLSWKAGRTKDAGRLQVVAFDVEILVKAPAPLSSN